MTQIDWDLLTRYLAGTCTPSERQWIERLVAANPEISHVVAAARDIARDGDSGVTDERLAERLAAIKGAGRPIARRRDAVAPRFSLPGRRRSLLRVAAGIAAIAGAAGTAVWFGLRHPAHPTGRPAFSVISTALGQRFTLRLSDSTLVSLAPGSTLRTPAQYGKRDRIVELEGEAVFTVTHDSVRPFAVRTPRAVVTDLGTRFVVRAYGDDPATDVVVAEGKVAVQQTAAAQPGAPVDSVILGGGERVRVADDGRVQLSRGVPLEDYFAWTEGKLIFRGTLLHEAARRLGRWYDIEVRLEPSVIGDRRIVATAGQEPALDVLQAIAASLDLRLSRAGRVFTLTAN